MTLRSRFLQALITAKLEFAEMNLQDQTTLLVTQRGGRAFLFHEEKSVYWLPDVWHEDEAVKDFLSSGHWNMGGERVYVGPEIQYGVRDRSNFQETLFIPKSNDPGHYTLRTNDEGVALEQTLELEAFNLAQGEKKLTLKRFFSRVPNPIRHVALGESLMQGVKFAGYAQEVVLRDLSYDGTMSESWLVTQLPRGGDIIIPASEHAEVTPFFGASPADVTRLQNGCFRIPLEGSDLYKLGYKSAFLTGSVAYVSDNLLVIRTFFNNPSSEYAEEPPNEAGNRGHSVFVFNDGGNLGGFGELECNGQPVGVAGKSTTHDLFVTWLFMGEQMRLRSLAEVLLGARL
jgi:hypothetical protein